MSQANYLVYQSLRNTFCPMVAVRCSVPFRSVQDGIYSPEKAHMRSTMSLRSFPNVAFETVPVFAWLTMAPSRLFKGDRLALPLWTPVRCFIWMHEWNCRCGETAQEKRKTLGSFGTWRVELCMSLRRIANYTIEYKFTWIMYVTETHCKLYNWIKIYCQVPT